MLTPATLSPSAKNELELKLSALQGTIDVVPVSGVTRLNVTDMSIVLMRGKKKPIIYPRSRVYYACCQKDMPPPQC